MEVFNQTIRSGTNDTKIGGTRVGGGLRGRGRALPPGSRIPLSEMMDIYYFKVISFALLYLIITVGLIAAFLTFRRPNIRKHSSAVYLFAMILTDYVLMGTWWLPWLLQFVMPELRFDDIICRVLQAFTITSRFGSCSIVIALVLERVLVISHPKRCARFATPQLAIIVSIVCIIITFLFGSYTLHGLGWHSRARCSYVEEVMKKNRAIPQNGVKVGAVFAGIAILLVLNIILGVKLIQKRQRAKNDPIKSSISNARNQSNQLNKINLICLLMSITCLVANVPSAVNILFFWHGTLQRLSPRAREIILGSTQFVAMFFLTTKWIIIGLSSPKIRREAWLAAKCSNDREMIMQFVKPEKRKNNNMRGASAKTLGKTLDNIELQARD